MVNFYVLRKDENIQLFNLLKREYIKEDYIFFVNAILETASINYKNISSDNISFSLNLLTIINKILLDNLCTMTINNKFNLLCLINNNSICKDLNIKLCYINDLCDNLLSNKYEDCSYFETEFKIRKLLEKYINYIYNNSSDKYNEVFIKLINMFEEELSWICYSNFKIEIIYDVTPVLVSTNSLTETK